MNRADSVNFLVVDLVLHWFWYGSGLDMDWHWLSSVLVRDCSVVVLMWPWLGYDLGMAWFWLGFRPGRLGYRAGCPI